MRGGRGGGIGERGVGHHVPPLLAGQAGQPSDPRPGRTFYVLFFELKLKLEVRTSKLQLQMLVNTSQSTGLT